MTTNTPNYNAFITDSQEFKTAIVLFGEPDATFSFADSDLKINVHSKLVSLRSKYFMKHFTDKSTTLEFDKEINIQCIITIIKYCYNIPIAHSYKEITNDLIECIDYFMMDNNFRYNVCYNYFAQHFTNEVNGIRSHLFTKLETDKLSDNIWEKYYKLTLRYLEFFDKFVASSPYYDEEEVPGEIHYMLYQVFTELIFIMPMTGMAVNYGVRDFSGSTTNYEKLMEIVDKIIPTLSYDNVLIIVRQSTKCLSNMRVMHLIDDAINANNGTMHPKSFAWLIFHQIPKLNNNIKPHSLLHTIETKTHLFYVCDWYKKKYHNKTIGYGSDNIKIVKMIEEWIIQLISKIKYESLDTNELEMISNLKLNSKYKMLFSENTEESTIKNSVVDELIRRQRVVDRVVNEVIESAENK